MKKIEDAQKENSELSRNIWNIYWQHQDYEYIISKMCYLQTRTSIR